MDTNKESPFCPRWSRIYGTPTTCLKEKCTNFIKIEYENEDGSIEMDGFCRDAAIYGCLCEIGTSLGILSGQLEMKHEPEEIAPQPKEDRMWT